MNDDLNTAVAFANLFNLLKYINMLNMGQLKSAALGEKTFNALKNNFVTFFEDVLGLKEELNEGYAILDGMLKLYKEYKLSMNYEKVDEIRSYFKNQGLVIRDSKTRIDWAYEE
jgi:cysteinyl-tRNA synthetase